MRPNSETSPPSWCPIAYADMNIRIAALLLSLASAVSCMPTMSSRQPSPAASQPKPDFSGKWTLTHSDKSPVGVAFELNIRCVDPTPSGLPSPALTSLVVERHSKSGTTSQTLQIGLSGGMFGGGGSVTRFSVHWDAHRLVMITSGTYSEPTLQSVTYTEHAEVWSMNRRGMLVMTVSDRGSSIPSSTTTLTYRKRKTTIRGSKCSP